jgi:hypothetical protein
MVIPSLMAFSDIKSYLSKITDFVLRYIKEMGLKAVFPAILRSPDGGRLAGPAEQRIGNHRNSPDIGIAIGPTSSQLHLSALCCQ